MKTSRKWRITGTVLLIAGLIVCGASAALFGFDFSALNTSVFVTNEYEISGSFRDVSVRGTTETVVFEKSTDGKCRVVCFEDEKQPHAASLQTDTKSFQGASSISLCLTPTGQAYLLD